MSAASLQPSRPAKPALLVHFAALADPRQGAKILYPLEEIVLLVVCATIAGADDLVEVREWGMERLEFLRTYLPFRDDVPSHDTLADVLNAIDPALFDLEHAAGGHRGLFDAGRPDTALIGLCSAATRGGDRVPVVATALFLSNASPCRPYGAHTGKFAAAGLPLPKPQGAR